MSKAVHKKDSVALTVSANQVLGTLDITNCNGVAVQLNGAVGLAGSMKLQYSLDNTNWADISGATATLSGVGPYVINQAAIYAGHIRVLATVSAGAGTYDFFMLGKER